MAAVNKRFTLYIITGLVLVLIIGAVILINPSTPTESVTELLSLGERFLSELNYEQALVQFLLVIEIEPRNAQAYYGAARAYLGLGQTNNAIDILRQGIEMTGDAQLQSMLDELTASLALYDSGDDTGNLGELTAEQLELLYVLIDAIVREDYLTAADIVGGEIYQQVVVIAQDTGEITYQALGTNLRIYPSGHVYVGDLYNGLRSGYGVWFRGGFDSMMYNYYSGRWDNDMPNGYGTLRYVNDENLVRRDGNNVPVIFQEYQGEFQNGLYHGTMILTHISDDDSCNHRWTLTFVSGIVQMMPSGSEGWYTAGRCEFCGALRYHNQTHDSRTYRIFGF